MKRNLFGILVCFLIPFISFTQVKENIRVALTKASPNYIEWIKKGDSSIVVIDLSNLKQSEALKRLNDCSALVITGGGDIDPALYGDDVSRAICKDIDQNRDNLERAMLTEALALKMPVLGICRGEQMINVAFGGSLIPDIPIYMRAKSQIKSSSVGNVSTGMETIVEVDLGDGKNEKSKVIHQCEDYLNCFHQVRLVSNSILRSITGVDTSTVTTNHHQAILKLGKGLKMNAQSADSLIEGIEWKDPEGKSFLIGVQWHPERMDLSNSFSGRLLQRFLAETRKYVVIPQNVK